MTEMEHNETGIDSLLRRSLAEPVPTLPPDFDRRLLREVRRRSQPLGRFGQILLTAYGLVSVITCALVMRGQGLDWGAIAVIVLGPLALIPAAGWVQRAQKTR